MAARKKAFALEDSVHVNTTYDLLRLEWMDAPHGSSEKHLIIPADFVVEA